MGTMVIMMTSGNTKTSTTNSDSNPPPPAVFHDFFGCKAPTFSIPPFERKMSVQLERISSYGPKTDVSVSEVSNQFVGSKRSHSDSKFIESSRKGVPQMIPESSHVMKMIRSASGGERFKMSPFDAPLHGVPHQIRPGSSFISQTTIDTNANYVNSERSIPTNVGGSNMPFNGGVMKPSPLLYQVPLSRMRDNGSDPSVLSQLAADEGSRTGKTGSGILNSINAGSNPVSERDLSGLVPNRCNVNSAAHNFEPECSNPPCSRGLMTSGSQMTIIYGGQVHVFDDVHLNKIYNASADSLISLRVITL
ncbi:protein TIFY 8 isoform X3 [Amaranthus tricolor]|uniref:protein TIFY 8 isoform X3 n=1 Tax=Amaranthus tricolor TaxID=29722 RepID=UPI002589218B|nr:protein TIFY 8 isoform X3 [Amaranthus tricolor]